MDIEQLISELKAKHYDQIRKSLQVVISPNDITMNPNLTANLRADSEALPRSPLALPQASADRELKAEIQQQQLATVREKLAAALPYLAEAIELMRSSGLAQLHSEIYSDVVDARFYCSSAIDDIESHPQPDQ